MTIDKLNFVFAVLVAGKLAAHETINFDDVTLIVDRERKNASAVLKENGSTTSCSYLEERKDFYCTNSVLESGEWEVWEISFDRVDIRLREELLKMIEMAHENGLSQK